MCSVREISPATSQVNGFKFGLNHWKLSKYELVDYKCLKPALVLIVQISLSVVLGGARRSEVLGLWFVVVAHRTSVKLADNWLRVSFIVFFKRLFPFALYVLVK